MGGSAHKGSAVQIRCDAWRVGGQELLYKLLLWRQPVHAFLHTYIGATLMVAVNIVLFLALRWFASKFWLPNSFRWQALLLPSVALGAAVGTYSHVLLDSVIHADIQPFSPFSAANPLLGVVPIGTLQLALLVLAGVGVVVVGLRRPSHPPPPPG